jgi:hypothetical protein
LVKLTTIVAARSTRMSGPGHWPLKPYATKERPAIERRTIDASSASVSPSFSAST